MKRRSQVSHNSSMEGAVVDIFSFSVKAALLGGTVLLVANVVPAAATLGLLSAYDVAHDAVEDRYIQQKKSREATNETTTKPQS